MNKLEYRQVTLDKIKIAVKARVSAETQHLIDNGDLFIVYDMADVLAYELRTCIWGATIGKGLEHQTVKVPKSWIHHFLVETKLGKLLAKVIEPKFIYHTLTVQWQSNVEFPQWVKQLPAEFGKAHIRVGHEVRYIIQGETKENE